MLPLTVLTSPSPTLRDDLARLLVVRRPALALLRYRVSFSSGRALLVREVLNSSGIVDAVELPDEDCVSCAVRNDVLEAADRVAACGRFDEVVLLLPVPVPASAVVPLLRGPHDAVALRGVTVVVDAMLVVEQLSGDELLVEYGLEAAPSDRRSMAELVVEQIEQADVLAVAQLWRAPSDAARALDCLLSHLAPLALRITLSPGGVGCDDVVTSHRGRSATEQERAQLARLARDFAQPELGVATVHWQATGPAHPERLHAALRQVLQGVLRSTGHIWLAGRAEPMAWASAGQSLSVGPADDGPVHGSELVLTGVGLDVQALQALLDSCLATPAELDAVLEDPFADVLGAGVEG